MSKDLQARLNAKVGTVAALKQEMTPKAKPSNSAARREEWKKVIADLDSSRIEHVRDLMTRYVDSMVTLDSDETKTLEPAQRKALMEEDLMRREIGDLLESRKETIKGLVFQTIINEAAEAGADEPELVNGEVVVEELGHRFTREGAGYSSPTFNMKALKEALGDDAAKVVTVEYKPVETINEEVLNSMLAGDPELIEKVRSAMVPGKPKNGSFYNRPIK